MTSAEFTKSEIAEAAQFVHLHNHSDYSMLDGAAKLPDIIKKVKHIGQTAFGLTDHGNMYGAYRFYNEAVSQDVKPILGVEAYLTPGTPRNDKTRIFFSNTPSNEQFNGENLNRGRAYTHMTMWAKNNEGLHNLFKSISQASLDSPFAKWARLDKELLEKYNKGVIATTGCPSSEIQARLSLGQFDKALKIAGEFQDIYGKENYYVELMDHHLDIETKVRDGLLDIAKKLDAPLVATNDSHCVNENDGMTHEALLCINSKKTLKDTDRFRFDGEGYYIRTTSEMKKTFSNYPDAIRNTLVIAEKCNVSFEKGINHMPKFVTPNGETEEEYLRKLVRENIRNRYKDLTDEIIKQTKYELDVICSKGYAGYFLVVADFINWAKKQGIHVGPGRGSAAGSIVSYVLKITELDPLQHGLIFERFLNPERKSMPDIDIDIEKRRREEVIRYVENKYGEDKVSQIVTYNTIKAKQAIRDSARILDFPYSFGDDLTKAIPKPISGREIKLTDIFDEASPRFKESSDFRDMYSSNPDYKQIVDLARSLEGIIRQWGVHAAGIIMSDVPITDIEPVFKRIEDGAVITQFDYPSSEALGLIKMDFLGLETLNIIGDALKIIKENKNLDIDLTKVPLNDEKTFDLLSRGDTLGVFQLDSSGMRSLLKTIRPDNFNDISACIALFRPGPMGMGSHTNYAKRKNGLQKIKPIHPELEKPLASILDETYGLVVYQEQVQRIAQKLANYTLGASDNLRRAMGKKKKEVLDKEYEPFSKGMKDNGFSDSAIKAIWDILVPFSDYAFNKAHSASYGMISYWTAYLKANYPSEYMAALLTAANKDKTPIYLNECRRMKIKVLTPDINNSEDIYTTKGNDILFGLNAIANVGGAVCDSIIKTRREKGEFKTFFDFLSKVPASVCNKKVLECLIKSGAFDCFGYNRKQLLLIHQTAGEVATKIKGKESDNQFGLFDNLGEDSSEMMYNIEIPNIQEWDKKEKMEFEKEMLGMYISDHPLSGLGRILTSVSDKQIVQIFNDDESEEQYKPEGKENKYFEKDITIAGMISEVQKKISKTGNPWASVKVEDLSGSIEVLFFGKSYISNSQYLETGKILKIAGQINKSDDKPPVIYGRRVEEVNTNSIDETPLILHVNPSICDIGNLSILKEIFKRYPGNSSVRLNVYSIDKSSKKDCRVDNKKDNIERAGGMILSFGAEKQEGAVKEDEKIVKQEESKEKDKKENSGDSNEILKEKNEDKKNKKITIISLPSSYNISKVPDLFSDLKVELGDTILEKSF